MIFQVCHQQLSSDHLGEDALEDSSFTLGNR
jgi:hypothetical protein